MGRQETTPGVGQRGGGAARDEEGAWPRRPLSAGLERTLSLKSEPRKEMLYVPRPDNCMRPQAGETPQAPFRERQMWQEVTREGGRRGGRGTRSHLQNPLLPWPPLWTGWYPTAPAHAPGAPLPFGEGQGRDHSPQDLPPPGLAHASAACHLPGPLQPLGELNPRTPGPLHRLLPARHLLLCLGIKVPSKRHLGREALPDLPPPQAGSCPCSPDPPGAGWYPSL